MMPTVAPMLAVRAEPFDSPDYLFEVKWNGIRALAASEQGQYRVWGRDRADYRERYPELSFLRRLPHGTVVDGELVLLHEGLPDLDGILGRHQRTNPAVIQQLSRTNPVRYIVFDILYANGHCLLSAPLSTRRAALADLVRSMPELVFSEGVVGQGCAFFEGAIQQGQEGIMAKYLASPYLPGRRSAAWRKIKPVRSLPCLVIGFLPGRQGFRSLLVAALHDGALRYVTTLRSGFTSAARDQLSRLLIGRQRSHPVVACPYRAVWIEPGVYCQVRYLEWTAGGRLRGASFHRLLAGAGAASAARTPQEPAAPAIHPTSR
jgi:ATP-dependent DNA ligase